jgi:peptide methionine sulfoxide reductase MsrA
MEKKATFGAGCFWGVEAAFRQLDGVTEKQGRSSCTPALREAI